MARRAASTVPRSPRRTLALRGMCGRRVAPRPRASDAGAIRVELRSFTTGGASARTVEPRRSPAPFGRGPRLALATGLLAWRRLAAGALGKPLASRFAVPFFECLVRDLPFYQQLSELAALRLTLERHV